MEVLHCQCKDVFLQGTEDKHQGVWIGGQCIVCQVGGQKLSKDTFHNAQKKVILQTSIDKNFGRATKEWQLRRVKLGKCLLLSCSLCDQKLDTLFDVYNKVTYHSLNVCSRCLPCFGPDMTYVAFHVTQDLAKFNSSYPGGKASDIIIAFCALQNILPCDAAKYYQKISDTSDEFFIFCNEKIFATFF